MGQKINPVGLRLGINRTWDSRWFAGRQEYGRLLHEDMAIRGHLMKQQREAGISKVVIERPHKKCRVTVHTARPGVLIGKKGAGIEKVRGDLAKLTSSEVHLNIVEIRKPEIDATLVAEGIAQQLERRIAFRRAMKRAVQSALRLGAIGIRINVAGRLGGAEIARTEWYREGRVPLHTLRADIDFGYGLAKTAYGIIGIKVWIFKGEIIEHDPMASEKKSADMQEGGAPRPRRDDAGGDRRERRGGRGGPGGPGGRGGRGGGGGRGAPGGPGGGAGGDVAPITAEPTEGGDA
ncbi:MAG: 30S ribosomal protein S3 [Hyphomicrobium sp.]